MKLALPPTLDLAAVGASMELKTLAGREALKIALENVKLLDNKQCDYGSNNISESGIFGVVVRMRDKLARLKNLTGIKLTQNDKDIIRAAESVLRTLKQNEHRMSLLAVIADMTTCMETLTVCFSSRRKKQVNESIIDTLRDSSNYPIIATMLETGKWPNE